MYRLITVNQGKFGKCDLQNEILKTKNLEACIAVAGVSNNYASLMHLTQICDLSSLFEQFVFNISNTNDVYLIGGMDKKSEHFSKKLYSQLNYLGYKRIFTDVLGPYRRNLHIGEKKITVELFNQWMDGGREIQDQVVGYKYIPFTK
jgi:hypothetical protein